MKSPFPQDWKEYTIGDCLRRVEHPVEVDSDALYTQIGIRSHGKGLFYKEPVTGELLGSKAVYWVEPNCFILNIVFAWEQAIGKTTQAEVGMIGSHRFPMYKPVNNLIDIDYLVYYLLTKRGTDILEAASPGGAGRNRTLGQDRFMKSKIVLPPLDEQKKIAEILSTQDKAVELQARKIEELKRFKKGCLEKMFPRKGQKVPEKRFPGFTDDWERRKLGSIYEAIGNAFVGTATPYYVENGHFYLESNNIKDGQINHNTEVFINDEFYEKQKDKWLHTGDMVMVQSGHVGHAAVIPEELDNSAAHALIMFRHPKIEIEPYFLNYQYQTLKSKKKIENITTGNTIKHILASDMQQFEVDMPKLEERKKIAEFFRGLDRLIALHQCKLEEMKRQKKALMQLLLTGIVRVKA